ncbi:unnamed protein product [Calypogeia fissa]
MVVAELERGEGRVCILLPRSNACNTSSAAALVWEWGHVDSCCLNSPSRSRKQQSQFPMPSFEFLLWHTGAIVDCLHTKLGTEVWIQQS